MIQQINKPDSITHQQNKQEKFTTYPNTVVEADKKLNQVQTKLLQILITLKQNSNATKKQQIITPTSTSITIHDHNKTIQPINNNWQYEDIIDNKTRQYIQLCQNFYQSKLQQQINKYKELKNQNKDLLSYNQSQVALLKQKIEQMQKQSQRSKSKIKKLQVQTQQSRNLRKNQKQRIVQMLMQQKQELFNKYTQFQKQNLVLLQFIHKVDDIILRKFTGDEKEDDLSKITHVREIQLQASNFYAKLTNPMIQQILNAFTQVFNVLNKKYQKITQLKSNKLEKSGKKQLKISTFKSKTLQKQKLTSDYQIAILKQQKQKLLTNFQAKLKEVQTMLDFERQKCNSMKRKIQKYQQELEKRNKELLTFHQKEADTLKKIKWLQEQILDYQRKLKMHNQEMKIFQYQRGYSQTVKKQAQIDEKHSRNKSKSAMLTNSAELALQIKPHVQVKQHISSVQTIQAQEIKHLKQTILNMNQIQLDNQEAIRNNQKTIDQLLVKYANQELVTKQKQKSILHQLQIISQNQLKIQKLGLQIKQLIDKLQSKQVQANSSEVNRKAVQLQLQECNTKTAELLKQIYKIYQLSKIQKGEQQNVITYESCISGIIPQIQGNLSSLKQKYWGAYKKLQNNQLQINGLKQKLIVCQVELDNITKIQNRINQQNQKLKQKNNQLEIAHKKQLQELKGKLLQMEQVHREYSNSLQKLREQSRRQLKIKQQHNNILLTQKQGLRKQNQQFLGTIQKFKQQIAQLTNRKSQLTEKLVALENQSRNSSLILQQMTAKDAKVLQLQQQYKQLNQILIQKDKLLQQTKNTLQISKNQVQQQKNKFDDLQKKYDEMNKNLAQVTKKIQQKESKITQLDLKNKQLQQKYTNLQLKYQQNQNHIQKLHQQLTQMQQKISDSIMNKNQNNQHSKNQSQIEDNLSQSKQLSMMHSQINSFKQQLNQLLHNNQQKDKQITRLKLYVAELQRQIANNKQQQGPKITQQKAKSLQNDKTVAPNLAILEKQKEIKQLIKIANEQKNQIQMLKIRQIKHQMLVAKANQLQQTLCRQKQLYQNQITKNNVKVFQLEGQIRRLKQQCYSKKRKVMSEEYFSLDPFSNKFSSKKSKEQSDQKAYRSKNVKAATSGKQSVDQFQADVYHSLEDDFEEEVAERKKQELQIENNIQTKSRKRMSQAERKNFATHKVQKKSSIENQHDSEQKSIEQKIQRKSSVPIKKVQESPDSNNHIQPKQANASKLPNAKTTNLQGNQEPPLITSSQNSLLNQAIKNLTQENRFLKVSTEKLTKDLIQMSQIIQIFDKGWRKQKELQSGSEQGKLVSLHKLQQNLKLLQMNKNKIFQQSNQNEKPVILQNIFHLIHETKRWVELIEKLTNQNKRVSLQMALYKKFPRLVKTTTLKLSQYDDCRRRSRTVYSQGNVYQQNHIEIDDLLMHDEQNQPHQPVPAHLQAPTNSLQILFKQNQQMSQISSVKHKSYNSGFLNSRSQIAKIFEKGEKHEKEHREAKKEEHKKDLVDQYAFNHKPQKQQKQRFDKNKNSNVVPNLQISSMQHNPNNSNAGKSYHNRLPNSFLQSSPLMQKSTGNYYQQTSHIDLLQNRKYQDRSAKSKRRMISKNLSKMTSINAKLAQNKKECSQVLKNVIQKYEDKIAQLQSQFTETVKKIMQNSVTLQEHNRICKINQDKSIDPRSNKKNILSGRISQKDEQIQERVQQMQSLIQKLKKQIQLKDKNLQQVQNQTKQLEKKIKEQKIVNESFKTKYLTQLANSSTLRQRYDKINLDFERFIVKIVKEKQIKQICETKTVEVQVDLQVEVILSPINAESTKKFLKSKKVTKNEVSLKDKQPISTSQQKIPIQNQGQKKQNDIRSSRQIQSGQICTDLKEKSAQKTNKIESKQQLVIPSILDRSKSENNQINKKKQQKRQSDKSQNQGKSLSIGAMITNILNPNSSLTKKKTISQASKPDQVIYYQQKLKQINDQLKNILSTQSFKFIQVESQIQIQSQDEIFKNKNEKQSRMKSQVQRPSQIQKQKIKENQKKIKDEQEIVSNLTILGDQINIYKKEVVKANNEWQQRLRQIIKSLIDTFKISRRSVQKIIDLSEKKDNSAAKYVGARIFFKQVFNQLNAKQIKGASSNLIKPNRLSSSDQVIEAANKWNKDATSAFNIQLPNDYESFQQKYAELQKYCDKLKAQLAQKNSQLQANKIQATGSHADSKKVNSRHASFNSNQNEDHFEDFENKQLFDNTKPTFEYVEQLKLENEYYKKKCQQYETLLNKKKVDKLKYIRKW